MGRCAGVDHSPLGNVDWWFILAAGGPTVERIVPKPSLNWRRVSETHVRLLWTDRFRLSRPDEARLFLLSDAP